MNINDLIKTIEKNKPQANIRLIKDAYVFASSKHKNQKRESGEPFIEHPLQTANILAEHSFDDQTIVAGLLHDVVEDTNATLKEIKAKFGDEIANIVDGVTKISKLHIANWQQRQAENIRKMILASAKDIRVIFVKLADKLHNMRTIESLRDDKRIRISQEVMDIYAPIAYKLGISSIKTELEDLAFKQLYPDKYTEIRTKMEQFIPEREKEMEEFKAKLLPELAKNGIKPLKIFGRVKHIYSIYKKMLKHNYGFENVYDLLALRVITKTVKECYEIIGVIHQIWKPVPRRFKDYIAMPKDNMYQSLHTTIVAKGHPVEIQVRTEDMDKIAEEGVAAHWHYKGVYGDKEFDAKLSWLKQILDWQRESKSPKEFMDMLHVDFFEKEIYTFTPKGDVISLPKGACVLDFAYAVHTNIGDKCTGAKVNGKFVTLRTELKNGDLVEIITSKSQKPSRDWLKFVKTSKAKTKIKHQIRELEKIPVKSYTKKIVDEIRSNISIIEVIGSKSQDVHLARCCNPLPGDMITGFISATGKVTVHKNNCPNLVKVKHGKRKQVVKVNWFDAVGAIVEIKARALNRVGIFAEILNSIVATRTTIKAANAKNITSDMIECGFSIESKSLGHVKELLKRIKKIKGVKGVFIGSVTK